VVLVRHGLTPTTGKELPEPGPGPSLTEQGRKQAEEAGRYIAEWRGALPPIVALFSSPLVRTVETAGIVGKALDLVPVERRGLVDCDAGEWAGSDLKQLAKKPEWSTVQHYPSGFRFPGGESIAEMQSRVVGAVKELVVAHPGRAVVVVSHADPIKAVLADALGVHLDLFQRIQVAPASVSAVSYSDAGPGVMLTNWTSFSSPAASSQAASGQTTSGPAGQAGSPR
jgi:probable phosphomutase (TIGR03848 family)